MCVTARYYLANSQNVQGRKGFCDVEIGGDVDDKINSNAWQNNQWYNNQDACEANGFDWRDLALSDVMDAKYPVCAKTQFARVNQVRSRRAISRARARTERGGRVRNERRRSISLARAELRETMLWRPLCRGCFVLTATFCARHAAFALVLARDVLCAVLLLRLSNGRALASVRLSRAPHARRRAINRVGARSSLSRPPARRPPARQRGRRRG